MNILVVGGRGNLGKGFVECSLQDGNRTHVWDLEEDIFSLTPEILGDLNLDFVINFSVIADLKNRGIDLGAEDYRVNVIGLSHLERVSQIANLPLIQISTREVIGLRDFRSAADSVEDDSQSLKPIDESEPCNPLHSYGKTKLIGEFLLQGKPLASVIRLNSCYTDDIRSGKGLIAGLALKSRASGEVVLDNFGSALRDPLHISDLYSLAKRIIETKSYGRIFHAGGGVLNYISLREICELANSNVKIRPGKISTDYGFLFDISQAQSLGWNPRVEIREWLRSVDWGFTS